MGPQFGFVDGVGRVQGARDPSFLAGFGCQRGGQVLGAVQRSLFYAHLTVAPLSSQEKCAEDVILGLIGFAKLSNDRVHLSSSA